MDDLNNLIQKAQKGDKDAYGQIYDLFYRRIFRFCKFNCPSEALAQDICQETFLKAYKALPTFSAKGGSLQAYLFKIARNLIIDNSRKKKEERIENYNNLESHSDMDEKIDKDQDINRLKEALKQLNEIERQIITLHYFEDMTQSEVAKVMGIRAVNLRVKSHRALKKLKEILESN